MKRKKKFQLGLLKPLFGCGLKIMMNLNYFVQGCSYDAVSYGKVNRFDSIQV